MYATIRRFDVAGRIGDELIPDGRRLATAVSKEPGFIAYALLDVGDGVLMSVCIFEEAVGLAGADALVERWGAAHDLALADDGSASGTGEVIVQRGI